MLTIKEYNYFDRKDYYYIFILFEWKYYFQLPMESRYIYIYVNILQFLLMWKIYMLFLKYNMWHILRIFLCSSFLLTQTNFQREGNSYLWWLNNVLMFLEVGKYFFLGYSRYPDILFRYKYMRKRKIDNDWFHLPF